MKNIVLLIVILLCTATGYSKKSHEGSTKEEQRIEKAQDSAFEAMLTADSVRSAQNVLLQKQAEERGDTLFKGLEIALVVFFIGFMYWIVSRGKRIPKTKTP